MFAEVAGYRANEARMVLRATVGRTDGYGVSHDGGEHDATHVLLCNMHHAAVLNVCLSADLD